MNDLSAPLPRLDFIRHQLTNGLRVILHRDASLPLVAINIWYHTGSKDERPGRTGFAHLFEHMLFQGSAHVATNEHFRYVQSVGGVANGSTWFDRTNYFETLPATCLELGLWLESDRMGWLLPAMTSEKLERQREVVMNERRQRVDNQPYGRASERIYELLFPSGHPYSWPVIGYMEDIAAASLDDVHDFFKTHYVPANAVLTLAGDFEPAVALDLVERYFGDIPGGGAQPAQPAEPEGSDRAGGERFEKLEDRVHMERLYLAYRLPAYGEREWYAGDVLSRVLSEGKSSRLYRDLVYERELAQSVACYALPTELCGSFHVVATCRPEVPVAALEEAVEEHLGRAAREPVSPAELARARNQITTGAFAQLQTLDRRADLFSKFTTYFDRPQDVAKEPTVYLDIDEEELQGFAARFLRRDDRARLHVHPA